MTTVRYSFVASGLITHFKPGGGGRPPLALTGKVGVSTWMTWAQNRSLFRDSTTMTRGSEGFTRRPSR